MNELATTNSAPMNLLSELEQPTSFICTMSAETREDKAKVFNLTNNPTHRLSDCINMEIAIRDIFVELVECESNKTPGEKDVCPRIVLIDDKGESYQCVSFGVFNAIKKIISLMGTPTWEEPVKLIPKQINKGTNSILTIVLA